MNIRDIFSLAPVIGEITVTEPARAPASMLDAADWSGIEALARDAVSL